MSKIAVIGDATSVLGFKAFGLETFPCQGADDAMYALRKIASEDYGIIYITERFYRDIQEEVNKYADMRTPAIIPIPGADGTFGMGIANVKKNVEKAVGADILFGGDK